MKKEPKIIKDTIKKGRKTSISPNEQIKIGPSALKRYPKALLKPNPVPFKSGCSSSNILDKYAFPAVSNIANPTETEIATIKKITKPLAKKKRNPKDIIISCPNTIVFL